MSLIFYAFLFWSTLAPVSPSDELTIIINDFRCDDGSFGAIHPDSPPELTQYGQLAGLWSMEGRTMNRQGEWEDKEPAFWAFKYILGGHAVQDMFLQETADGETKRISQLRYFDAETERWSVSWINTAGPRHHGRFSSWLEGEELIMDDPDASSDNPYRIVFKNILADSFVWEYQIEMGNPARWLTVSELSGTRLE